MVGVADEHRAQAVEGDLAVGLGVADLRALGRRLQVGVVGGSAVQRPRRRLEAELGQQPLLDAGHQRGGGAPLLEPLLEVARQLELLAQPALVEGLRVVAQLVVLAAGLQRRVGGLGGEHAGLDRGVAALDAAGVQVAGLAADQSATAEHRLGQAEDAAGGDGARPVADALAAFEQLADLGVRLPALEFLEGAEPGVRIVEPDHESQHQLVVLGVIEERAAVGVRVQRPAGGVQHMAGPVLGRVDLPQFLQADAVALRVAAGVELEALDQLLAQVATRALGEDRVLGVQLHADLEAVVRLAVLAHAHVAGGHALDRAVVVVEHLGGGEAGEDLHAQRLGLLAEPAHQRTQADDVVAVVLEAVGQQELGRRFRAGLVQEQELVGRHRLVQRRAFLFAIRDQLGQRLRVHHRAGQDVRAGLRALLEHHHRNLAAFERGQLLQPDRGGQAGGAAADHHHVVFHRFARAVLLEDLLGAHRGSWETGLHAILRASTAK